jgi:peptide/nickel transport system ATP-binding protein
MPSLLEVRNLRLTAGGRPLVDGIDLTIETGEWFALIGESGSGKSLTAASIANLLPRGVDRAADRIDFAGQDLLRCPESGLRELRGRRIGYVFQDYDGAFTPFRRLGAQLDEVLRAHTDWDAGTRRDRVLAGLEEVGLPAELYRRYPFQVSGGQLQRIALALAMLLEPELLVADEPTTALDAVNAGRVLDCIAQLRAEHGCAVLFITHDLRSVRRRADRIAIMRNGGIVETGPAARLLAEPREAYTRNLLGAIPPLRNPPDRLPVLGEDESEVAS